MSVWHIIIGIDDTITIVVDDEVITRQLLIIIRIKLRHCVHIIPSIGIACIEIRVILTDGEACGLLIIRSKLRVIVKLHLVYCMGHIEVTPETESICKNLVYLQF